MFFLSKRVSNITKINFPRRQFKSKHTELFPHIHVTLKMVPGEQESTVIAESRTEICNENGA